MKDGKKWTLEPIERDMEGKALPARDDGAAVAAATTAKAGKKPRKDRGTRRVNLPVAIVEDLDRRFPGAVTTPEAVSRIIKERDKAVALAEGAITLPPAVLSRLAPAAAGSGRSISELLADIEGYLCDLLDGRLLTASPRTGDQTRAQAPPPSRPANVWGISSLEELLVEAFRARLRPPQEPTS